MSIKALLTLLIYYLVNLFMTTKGLTTDWTAVFVANQGWENVSEFSRFHKMKVFCPEIFFWSSDPERFFYLCVLA